MRYGIRFVVPVVLTLCAGLYAAVPCALPAGIERLPNGNTLFCDAGAMGQPTARVIEIDSNDHLVYAYIRADILWAHSGRRTGNGNTLITATDSNRVFEVTPRGDVVWEMRAGLDYPNEAYRLANGNTLITDRDNDRVIEVDSARNIVWSYTNLTGPHGGNRLANGNTLISNSEANRIIEVDTTGSIVWQYTTGLSWPRCAQRLSNGNTLITSSSNNRGIEVDSAGTVVWSVTSGLSQPYQATRLANGNTLISTGARIIEVNPATTIVWQYPPVMASAVAVDTLWVVNPRSGCSLYVHIHRPVDAGPSARVPAVVLIPDQSSAGTVLHNFADSLATEGFAVLHFDADGRGQSSGTEDYNGYVHQDGLAACAAMLASRPYVDSTNMGIYSRGYGIVMATGMIARHETPSIKFLMDWEGPSDRYQTSSDSGGHVPVPVDSDAFWVEREAGRFIKSVPGAYLRYQSATDHTGRIADNHHAIALVDSATSTAHGGSGIAVWTRVNDSVMNPTNHTYSVSDPPLWTRETEDRNRICREILYLHELADSVFQDAISSRPSSLVPRPSPLVVSPNPCRGSVRISGSSFIAHRSSLSVYDASGRLVLSQPVSSSSFILHTSSLRAGVYMLRLCSDGRFATARLIIEH
jgi:alpha/beta superfamily hydrolase